MSLLINLKSLSFFSIAGGAIPAITSFVSTSPNFLVSKKNKPISLDDCHLIVRDNLKKHSLLYCDIDSESLDEYYGLYDENNKSNKEIASVVSLEGGKFKAILKGSSETIVLETEQKQFPKEIDLKSECIIQLKSESGISNVLWCYSKLGDMQTPTLPLSKFKEPIP